MKILNIFIFGLMLSACAKSYDPNKEYGFIMQENEQGLENPPPNKTRLYGFRYGNFGAFVRYNATLHTQSQINKDFDWGSFFGRSRPNFAFFIDIEPSNEPIFISGKTEARDELSFTPKANRIYCVELGIKMGVVVGRPNIVLVDKQECLEIVPRLLKKDFRKTYLIDKQDYEAKKANKVR